MSVSPLQSPDHLEPDPPPIAWRQLVTRAGVTLIVISAIVMADDVAEAFFGHAGRAEPCALELVLGTSVECTRTSALSSPVGASPSPAPEETKIWPRSCEDLGLQSREEPVLHDDGKRYIDTYKTDYGVRVAKVPGKNGHGSYPSHEAEEYLRVVDRACFEAYSDSDAPHFWDGCPPPGATP